MKSKITIYFISVMLALSNITAYAEQIQVEDYTIQQQYQQQKKEPEDSPIQQQEEGQADQESIEEVEDDEQIELTIYNNQKDEGAVLADKIKVDSTGEEYDSLTDAIKAAAPQDIVYLGDGTYTTYSYYGQSIADGKSLTFIGTSTDTTVWNIGTDTFDNYNQWNADRSLAGAESITFENMTLQSGVVNGTSNLVYRDYTGFAHTNHTIVKDCIIKGTTWYWGYESSRFQNVVFEADTSFSSFRKYIIDIYTGTDIIFDNCTFNNTTWGRIIHAYREEVKDESINITLKDCTFNSTSWSKTAVVIKDNNNNYNVTFQGNITINNSIVDSTTCSRLFSVEHTGEQSTNATVSIENTIVWQNGAMVNHQIDISNGSYQNGHIDTTLNQYTEGYKDDAYTYTDWALTEDSTQYTSTKTCNYCGYSQNIKAYKLILDPNGGVWSDDSSDNKESDYTDINKEVDIQTPTRDGYVFDGWAIANNEKNDDGEYINNTLTAKWGAAPANSQDEPRNDPQEDPAPAPQGNTPSTPPISVPIEQIEQEIIIEEQDKELNPTVSDSIDTIDTIDSNEDPVIQTGDESLICLYLAVTLIAGSILSIWFYKQYKFLY